jgi:hypothetical protein
MNKSLASALLICAMSMPAAHAGPSYTWNTTGGFAPTYSKIFPSTAGNEPIKATGYSTRFSDGSGKFLRQQIVGWGGGLGVKSANGSGENSSPNHATDNNGPDELIVFEFDDANYEPTGFRIGWKSGDADIRVWIGGTTSIDLTDRSEDIS